MCRGNLKLSSTLLLAILLIIGCASVNYVGKSYSPTTSVDVYYSKEEIEKEYTVLGHAVGSGSIVSNESIKNKLISEAKNKGADAILITGIGKVKAHPDDMNLDENQINASFLKYK